MKGFLCSGIKAKTNEEYRKMIRKRIYLYTAAAVIGILTAVLALMAEYVWETGINEHAIGVYCGLGTGIAVGCLILGIKDWRLLRNEEKLKESRLECNDERIEEINNRALRSGLLCLIGAMYVIGLIGGIFYPILTKVLLIQATFFLLAYRIAYKVYEKKM